MAFKSAKGGSRRPSAAKKGAASRGPQRGRGKGKSAPPKISYGAAETVTINSLGARGDGIAEWRGKSLFVPFTLPGETVSARPGPTRQDGVAALLDQVITPSEDRVSAPCPHFQSCGGCALQHLDRDHEIAWKRDLLVGALAHRGFENPESLVKQTIVVPQGTRRRLSMSYKRIADRLVLGFNARHSHQIVEISDCLLATNSFNTLIPQLKTSLAPWLPVGSSGNLLLVETDVGVDALIDLTERPDLAGYQGLSDVAHRLDLARLSMRLGDAIEPLIQIRVPTIAFHGTTIPLPPGAFLQPSSEGQAALQKLVLDGLEGTKGPVADLFCGVGTFALAIAAGGRSVTAFDHLAPQVAPLHATGRVIAQSRDLSRQPLLASELQSFSAVVLDPPRAGAKEQCEAFAHIAPGCPPSRVVMVSCNPSTFARDARMLENYGYRMLSVTPVDQFIWSAHVEAVAIFDRVM